MAVARASLPPRLRTESPKRHATHRSAGQRSSAKAPVYPQRPGLSLLPLSSEDGLWVHPPLSERGLWVHPPLCERTAPFCRARTRAVRGLCGALLRAGSLRFRGWRVRPRDGTCVCERATLYGSARTRAVRGSNGALSYLRATVSPHIDVCGALVIGATDRPRCGSACAGCCPSRIVCPRYDSGIEARRQPSRCGGEGGERRGAH